MKNSKNNNQKKGTSDDTNLAEKTWKTGWTYIRTVVDTANEPFLLLDEELHVIAANYAFYTLFEVRAGDTENRLLQDLGQGEWNIPTLQKLLKDILLHDTFFRGFEMSRDFPAIGKKVMLLNARRVHLSNNNATQSHKSIILLVIEDITEMSSIAEKLSRKTKKYENNMIERAEELDVQIAELSHLNKSVTEFKPAIAELASVVDGLRIGIEQLGKR